MVAGRDWRVLLGMLGPGHRLVRVGREEAAGRSVMGVWAE